MAKDTIINNLKINIMKAFSKNNKLNGVLNDIHTQLLEMCETKKESICEIKRYAKNFSKETDYNLAQYGNLIIYHDDVLKMYENHGYKSLNRLSNDARWNIYKRQVGYVVRCILDNKK